MKKILLVKKMNRQEKIEDLEYQIKKIDGHTLACNIGNRVHGILGIGLGLISAYVGTKCHFPLDVVPYLIGAGFVIDGVGSLATGKLHYVLFRATRTHPKYELKRLGVETNEKSVGEE